MRNKILLLAMVLLSTIGMSSAFAQTMGGPDTYGYIWKTDQDTAADAPTFVWNSIVGAPGATQITGLLDDNSVAFIDFGWDFHYYWTNHHQFKMGSNGWIGFNNIGNIASCFPHIPVQGGAGDNYLAPFMSDLIFSPGAGNPAAAWWWSNNTDTVIIEYSHVGWWVSGGNGWIGDNSLQVILSGVDSSITFMYADTDVANWTDNSGCDADMEIGIENITGNIGLEVFNEALPTDSSAIKFFYPDVVSFQIPDATPAWNGNPDNAGQFVIAGSNATAQTLMANVSNVGNGNITNNIAVAGDIRLPSGGPAYWTSSTGISTGLAAQADSTVTFPTQVTFTTPNIHYNFKVTTTNSQDINPSNNINIVELVTVACTGDTSNLTYSSGTFDNAIIWSGGSPDEGAGMYVVPPSYPANIHNVDIVIADLTSSSPGVHSPFSIKIFNDSGLPGMMLDSVTVPQNSIVEDVWHRVRMNGTSTINSGGWYIAWYQGGADVAMATETQAPISRQTFEILGGGWSPYRDATVSDFQMSANISLTCPLTSVKDNVSAILDLKAAPNPTNGMTSIRYELPAITDVKLEVVNMFGQTVFTKNEIGAAAGKHSVDFNAQDLASGIYYINLMTSTDKMISKLMVNH